MKKTIKILLSTLAILVCSPGTYVSAAGSGAHMKVLGRTSQPIGHAQFCQAFPRECRLRSKNTKAPKLTRKRWSDLVEINAQINDAVIPVTDLDYYNKEEHWTYPKSYGDCEDYVLLKRYMLMKRGWPASSLLITVVRQPNGEGHAVLTVRTNRADYVLDNLEPRVKQWNKTPYRYLKRQSAHHTGRWSSIRDSRNQVAHISN
ncbi:MAG: transglutaminase-like cysteine peptidase [Pseudomonadota bacterium]